MRRRGRSCRPGSRSRARRRARSTAPRPRSRPSPAFAACRSRPARARRARSSARACGARSRGGSARARSDADRATRGTRPSPIRPRRRRPRRSRARRTGDLAGRRVLGFDVLPGARRHRSAGDEVVLRLAHDPPLPSLSARRARSITFSKMRAVAASIIMPPTAFAPSPPRSARLVRLDHPLRGRDLLVGRREHLVRDLDLARVDRPLADGAERRRPRRVFR